MHDRKAHLLNAEDAVWAHPANSVVGTLEAHRLVNNAAAALGIDPPTLEFVDADCNLESSEGVIRVPRWACTPLGLLHSVAHAATPSVFPPHGAEFCANLLKILPPDLAVAFELELDDRGVHRTAEQRVKQSRRELQAAVKRGKIVEMVFDDPPEMIVAPIDTVHSGDIRLCDGRLVPLDRLRYAAVA